MAAQLLQQSEKPKLVARDRLDSLRTNLITLIDSLYSLQQQISYGGAESMMSWPDLVAKYSLLLSNTHSISTQLGQPPHASSQSHRELERNLSRIAVFPGKPVDQSLDYRVGVLLRTKQYPEIEDAQRSLLDALPADLKHKDGEANEEDLTKLATATQQHDKLIRFALRRLRGISGIDTGEEEDSEDEEVDAMQQDEGEAPQYDWRMRLEPEQPAPSITANAKEVLQGVAAILRDGR